MVVAAHPGTEPGYHDDTGEVFFVESTAWFTPSGPTGVGNADHEAGAFMGWSDEEPSSPVGGATVATAASGLQSLVDDEAHDRGQFTATGQVTGHLDTLVLDLFYVSPVADRCGLTLAVDLDVDGLPVLDMDGIFDRVEVFTEPAGSGHTAVRLKITRIDEQLRRFGGGGHDFVGDADTVHDVTVSVQQYPLCNEVVWRYGTSDFPASITFNRDPAHWSLADHTTFDVTDPPKPPPA